MDFKSLLFTFDGRINRAKYWLATLGMLAAMIAAVLTLASIGITYGIGNGRYVIDVIGLSASVKFTGNGVSTTSWYPQIVTAPLSLAFAWMYAAVCIKRLHDRNKSGWWLLPFVGATSLYGHSGDMLGAADPYVGFLAAVLFVWGFFEMAFLKGTTGTNRFGADPLAPLPSRTPATPVTYPTTGGPNELRVAYVIKSSR